MAHDLIIDFDEARERANFLRMAGALTKMQRITICQYRRRRTNPQNAYMWAVVYPAFTQFRQEQGEEFTDEMSHEFFKHKFLRQTVVNKDTGEVLGTTVPSTTALNVEDFAVYLDKIICWLADYGINVPPPEQDYRKRELQATE